MREHIYRAYDKGKMNQPFGLLLSDTSKILNGLSNESEILDFTGKVDKKSVRIFDGDFIKDTGGNIGLVEWNNDHAQYLVNFNGETQELLGVEEWGEVCGNKFQNPELLKELE
jgi:hypothetical protein